MHPIAAIRTAALGLLIAVAAAMVGPSIVRAESVPHAISDQLDGIAWEIERLPEIRNLARRVEEIDRLQRRIARLERTNDRYRSRKADENARRIDRMQAELRQLERHAWDRDERRRPTYQDPDSLPRQNKGTEK